MMRKNITRTLIRSDIHAYCVKIKDGNPTIEQLPVVTVWGKPTDAEAMKAVKEAHGKDISITIGKIVQETETYKIGIDAFVANAIKVEGEEAEEVEE